MTSPDIDSPSRPAKRASQPSDRLEKIARRNGATLVAGVDEVGRGPLAGPVVTAAVAFQGTTYPSGLNDSKRLSARARAALFDEIMATASVSIAVASLRRIEQMNILHASLWAMTRAIRGLPTLPDHVLVDGNKAPANMPCPCQTVVGGDAVSVSISAASIIAKVTRDRLMENVALAYPQYGCERHLGYGTPLHLAALREHGPCPQHRRGVAPVREQQLGLNF